MSHLKKAMQQQGQAGGAPLLPSPGTQAPAVMYNGAPTSQAYPSISGMPYQMPVTYGIPGHQMPQYCVAYYCPSPGAPSQPVYMPIIPGMANMGNMIPMMPLVQMDNRTSVDQNFSRMNDGLHDSEKSTLDREARRGGKGRGKGKGKLRGKGRVDQSGEESGSHQNNSDAAEPELIQAPPPVLSSSQDFPSLANTNTEGLKEDEDNKNPTLFKKAFKMPSKNQLKKQQQRQKPSTESSEVSEGHRVAGFGKKGKMVVVDNLEPVCDI